MNYQELVSHVDARIEDKPAEEVLAATLATLGERLTQGEGQDLAAELPDELGEYLSKEGQHKSGASEPFDVREFIDRVGRREGVTALEAEKHARAVFQVLDDAVSGQQLDKAMAQLPDDYKVLTKPWRA